MNSKSFAGDKIKAKEEKEKNVSLSELGLSAISVGLLGSTFGITTISPLLFILGTGCVVWEFLIKSDPYRKLWMSLDLQVGENTPRLVEKRKTDYGYCLAFSIPLGLSTDDFEQNQKAIEQHLNKKIEIAYSNHRAYIKVYDKELEKAPEFQLVETKGTCEFPIGIVYGGRVITVDLEKVVHLLIAGETGSGKSTLLRGILTHIISSKKKVSLHLVDLKNGAEFNLFRKCKQVKSFSRTKEEAEKVLFDLINEVDRRYDLFYQNDVVDIREYNRLKGVRKLDSQIVVVDEFADLQNEKDSTSAVEILAAKARACGIHLILSTQRPSANIINGTIKANIPAVIGFKTMNGLNSRIIIDEERLENLRGEGHGIFKFGELTEFQSFNITTHQARSLVKDTYAEQKQIATMVKKEVQQEEIKDFKFLKALAGGKK